MKPDADVIHFFVSSFFVVLTKPSTPHSLITLRQPKQSCIEKETAQGEEVSLKLRYTMSNYSRHSTARRRRQEQGRASALAFSPFAAPLVVVILLAVSSLSSSVDAFDFKLAATRIPGHSIRSDLKRSRGAFEFCQSHANVARTNNGHTRRRLYASPPSEFESSPTSDNNPRKKNHLQRLLNPTGVVPQIFLALVIYVFHVGVLAQNSISFPFQLFPSNHAGRFQSIGLDS